MRREVEDFYGLHYLRPDGGPRAIRRRFGKAKPRVAVVAERFEGEEISLPPHWGGYRVIPEQMEFWQGRPNRLHDRFRYTRRPDGTWQIDRLAP